MGKIRLMTLLTHGVSDAAYSYRNDPSVPPFPDDRPIIFFDGYCVLCSRFARFVLRRDRQGIFRLAAAQSPLGQAVYRHFALDPVAFESNLLLSEGRGWVKSRGTIRIFVRLGFPWSLVAILKLIPPTLIDNLYDLIARNRIRWFGARSVCLLEDPGHRDRFLQ